MSWFSLVIGQNASRQLATSSENLVASAQFLVALATSESQFRALLVGFSRSRSVQLTKIISLLLKVYNRGVKWELTMSHTATIDKVGQLGRAYDEKVLKWKAE